MFSLASTWQTTLDIIQVITGLPSCVSFPSFPPFTIACSSFIASLMFCTVWRYSTIGASLASMCPASCVACHGSYGMSVTS
jgi:hypothetical protein